MGLDSDDERPDGISIEDAYKAIRSWYQANVDSYASDPQRGRYATDSKVYIESLPPRDRATRSEMEDTLLRVLSRDLEIAPALTLFGGRCASRVSVSSVVRSRQVVRLRPLEGNRMDRVQR
jgi:hypothetical protein